MKSCPRIKILLAALTLGAVTPFFIFAQEDAPPAPPTETPASPEVEDENLRAIVRELTSDDFNVREAAQFKLWQAGKKAEKLLTDFIDGSGDKEESAEARMRMRRVLAEFSYGIYPDTKEEIVALIRQFRSGDLDERQIAISQLTENADFDLIFKLLGTVTDRDQREALSRVVARHTEEVVRKKIMEGDYDGAEKILLLSAVVPDAMQNFAVFCQLRGRSEAAAAQLDSSKLPEKVQIEIRHWLARVNGNFPEALKLAEELKDEVLIRETKVLQGDMAAYCLGAVDFNVRSIRPLTYKAALARHKGDTSGFSACIEDILKYLTEFPNEAESVYDALIANGRADEALEVVRKDLPLIAFNHLIRQERHAEALAVLGIDHVLPPYDTWLDKMCGKISASTDAAEAYTLFFEVYTVARFLTIHGLKKEAEVIMSRTADSLGDKRLDLSSQLCSQLRALGMNELLFAHADKIWELSEKSPNASIDFEDIVADIFRGYNEAAMQWSTRLAAESPDKDGNKGTALLRKVASILMPEDGKLSAEGEKILAETEKWLKENPQKPAQNQAAAQPQVPARQQLQLNNFQRQMRAGRDPFGRDPKERDWHRTLGETYAALERYDDAQRHYSQCQDADINGSTHLYAADYFAMQKKWKEASENYQKAWEEDETSELHLYLSGWALYREGGDSKAKGEEIMLKARLLMLADVSRNSEIGNMLWEQGDADLAEPFSRLILNIADPNDAECVQQASYLSLHQRYSDQEKEAAHLQERVLLFQATRKSSATILVSRAWLDVLEARAALRAGNKDAAMDSIRQALKLTPGDSSALEEFHPMLIERGMQPEADALFDLAYPVSKATAELFPKYDQANNNHAWLLARCKRNLDEALKHAKIALEIDPKSAATTDTLAEVYFAKGEFAKAVETSDKALELLPTDNQLRNQNQRFRAALEESKP